MRESQLLTRPQFQEIFVVNLPERTDRKDAMTLGAAMSDLSFTFSPGVRGADVPAKVLPPSHRHKGENWVGKTGSWRAHMNVLQRYSPLSSPSFTTGTNAGWGG